jgi:drug/metabolite transporter (DMT)-like permease
MAVTNAPAAQAETSALPAVSAPVWIGWAIALTAMVAFSIATPVARAALVGGMDPDALLAGRMVIATLLMGITIAASNPRRLLVPRRCMAIALGAGLLNAFGMVCYFIGLTRLEASMAAMMISLSPLAVLSLLALRGERVTYRHAIRLILALSGVYLLIGPGGDVNLVGVAWIVVAIFGFAMQLALLQWYLLEYDARAVTFYVLIAMTVGVLAWWVVQGMPWEAPGPAGWAAILALAVVGTYFARLLLFASVSRIGGGQTTMLSPLETLLSVIWAYIFLGERLGPVQLAGGVLILLSAILAIQRLRRAKRRPRWRVWART